MGQLKHLLGDSKFQFVVHIDIRGKCRHFLAPSLVLR